MRIALCGISHETNTYCAQPTPASAFYTFRGERMLAAAGQESDVGGAVDACLRLNLDPVPLLFASTQPSGVIERDAYEGFKAEILDGLEHALAQGLDAVVLLLHGAGVVDGVPDLEGDFAQAVRRCVGDLPVTASFDLHGNFTSTMTDALNGVFVCHQYPHIDLHLRAAEAVEAAADMARSGKRAACELIEMPLLLPTTTTFEGIGENMLERLLALESQSEALDLSWCHGFPYCDVAHVGSFVVATAYAEQMAAAREAAAQFAQELWAVREQFRPASLSAEQALAQAQTHLADDTLEGPVVINETSDNCGGGTPGDGTHLLREMLAQKLGANACFGFIVDPGTAAQAHEAGVGSDIEVQLGGHSDDLHGEPIQTKAYVKALHDGRLVLQHMFRGTPINLGPMARLVIDGMDVVVASNRSQTFDREPFAALGIDVMKYQIVALKSSNHFRAGFQHLARAIVTADTPGLTTHQIQIFPRQHTSRRLWPVDERAQFTIS